MRCRRTTILEAYLGAYIEAAGIRDGGRRPSGILDRR